MKTTPNDSSSPAPVLDSKWLRDVTAVTFNATGVRVTFKDGSVFTGNLEELREHIRTNRAAAIKNCVDASGRKIGVFHAFRPTNKTQREILSKLTGEPADSLKDRVFTFGSVHQARRFYKALKTEGCEGNPDRNWSMVAIDQTKDRCPV